MTVPSSIIVHHQRFKSQKTGFGVLALGFGFEFRLESVFILYIVENEKSKPKNPKNDNPSLKPVFWGVRTSGDEQ